jgi:hypothetical protein
MESVMNRIVNFADGTWNDRDQVNKQTKRRRPSKRHQDRAGYLTSSLLLDVPHSSIRTDAGVRRPWSMPR